MERVLTDTQHLWFVTITSGLAVGGGLLLWAGFITLGLISRRFEKAYSVTTHWQFHLVGPAGLVCYLVMQSVASLQHVNMGPVEQWIGYTLLVWSAGLSLWGVRRFRKVLKNLL